jgi:hypothetical protein
MKNGTRKGRSLSPGALSVLRAMIEAYEEGRERARYNAPDDGDTDDDG